MKRNSCQKRFILKFLVFLMIFALLFHSFELSALAGNENKNNDFDFQSAWNSAHDMSQNFFTVLPPIYNNGNTIIKIQWKNNGKNHKEAWFSLDKNNIKHYKERTHGNSDTDFTDEILLTSAEVRNYPYLYILLKEGNGNGSSYKKAQITIEEFILENSTKAPLNMLKTVSKNQFLVNEEFTINYKIQPLPIPIEKIIPESYLKDKEIVLVIDVSGSMNWDLSGHATNNHASKRMTITKNAVKLFVDKLKNDPRVKIGVVAYSSKADGMKVSGNDFIRLTNQSHYNGLINTINGLTAEGGTNIGDGLRRAYYLLKNSSDHQARKYIVLMTDGQPTAFSYDQINKANAWWNWEVIGYTKEGYSTSYVRDIYSTTFKTADGDGNKYYVNYGDYDHKGLALDYACELGKKISSEDFRIDSFIVGFSNDIHKNKLQKIADVTKGFYREAKTAEDINFVYEQLADQIQSDLPIHGIKFQETFPDGIQIVEVSNGLALNGQTVTGDIGNILYKLNKQTNQFEAQPFEFSIKVKGMKAGNYILGRDTSYIDYIDIDGTESKKAFPEIAVSIYGGQPLITLTNIMGEKDVFRIGRANPKFTFDITEADAERVEFVFEIDEIAQSILEGYYQIQTIPSSAVLRKNNIVLRSSNTAQPIIIHPITSNRFSIVIPDGLPLGNNYQIEFGLKINASNPGSIKVKVIQYRVVKASEVYVEYGTPEVYDINLVDMPVLQ
ncbi:VWA domain-containing protein [Thermotalea metallivorans]|uniref:VWFA domain-containing protein n=1 Tax=Thermotalea metallivorans TaxID=520762 RepID=A0A140L8A9_9FIRM|nr:vWA domain-containing protein [Thermotalea metallivorans]KXG76784.1 hypothetical protein AN619_07760 [Thermotalea metallivorans]